MPEEFRRSRASRFIRAAPQTIYAAFMDPAALTAWLPPGCMTGRIEHFEAGVGGGYRMTLSYPPDENVHRGKTSSREDVVLVRFSELSPPHRIVEVVNFQSDDPAFLGDMILAITLDAQQDGTKVTLQFDNLPPALSPADNDTGARQSLEQLARFVE